MSKPETSHEPKKQHSRVRIAVFSISTAMLLTLIAYIISELSGAGA